MATSIQVNRNNLSATAFTDIVNQVKADQGMKSDHHVRLRSDGETLYVRADAGVGRNFLTGIKDLFVGNNRRQEGLNVIRSAIAAEYKLDDSQLDKLFSNFTGGIRAHQLEGLQKKVQDLQRQTLGEPVRDVVLSSQQGTNHADGPKSEKAAGTDSTGEKPKPVFPRKMVEAIVLSSLLQSRAEGLNDVISKSIQATESTLSWKRLSREDLTYNTDNILKRDIISGIVDQLAEHLSTMDRKDALRFGQDFKRVESFICDRAEAFVYEQAGVPLPESVPLPEKPARAAANESIAPKLSEVAYQRFSSLPNSQDKTRAALHYLGLDSGADKSSIEKAYRAASRVMHPDQDKTAGATERFQQLGEIYSYLNPKSKPELFE